MPERVALIADVHGNTPALQSVLAAIERAGCTRLFMLGDIINGLDPSGCVDLLRHTWPDLVAIKGNAEHYLLTPALDVFPLRDQPTYVEVIALIRWWHSRLLPAQIDWLAGLPDSAVWQQICLVHDSPLERFFPEHWQKPEIDRQYQELCFHAQGLSSDTPPAELQRVRGWMNAQSIRAVFCGHTHDPFVSVEGDRLISNVGSVGLPLDGDPRASWVLLDGWPDGVCQATIKRVPYPIEATLALVDANPDYPVFASAARREAYRQMLIHGRYWRSFMPA